MRTRTLDSTRASRKLIRAAALVAATAVGVFGAQAAELETISLSEDICLSCAYEDGLPSSTDPAAGLRAVSVDADDASSTDAADDGSSFSRSSAPRPRIVLPVRDTGHEERLRWSTSEKALMWSFVSLSTIDAYQTMNAPGHVVEANPLLSSWAGDHPSALETVLFKGATTYAIVKLAGRVKKRSTRRLALALMNFVQLSVAAHNEEVTGGILF